MRAYLNQFNSASLKKYFVNTSWLFWGDVARKIVNFFVVIYVARYLGPAHFGLLNYSASFVYIFSTIAILGLNITLVKKLVQEPEESHNEILGSAFILRLGGSLCSFAMICIYLSLVQSDMTEKMLVLIIALSLFSYGFNNIGYYFQAKVESKFVVISGIVYALAGALLRMVLIYLQSPLLYFAMVILVESIVHSFMLTVMYHRTGMSIRKWSFNRTTAVKMLFESVPFALSGIFLTIHLKIDQVLIKELLTASDVGIYSVAVTCTDVWHAIPLILVNSLFPAILNTKKEGDEIYLNRMQKFFDLILLYALVICVPFTIFSKPIIQIAFGSDYVGSAAVIKVYIWSNVFFFFSLISSRFFAAQELRGYELMRNVLGVVFNVLLNLLLIPRMGVMGAALATLISYCFLGYISLFLFKESRNIFVIASKSFNIVMLFLRFKEER